MITIEKDQLGWELLNHGGLLVDAPRLRQLAANAPDPLSDRRTDEWRRRFIAFNEDRAHTGDWVSWVLERVCGFTSGTWQRGNQIGIDWSRTSLTGEVVRPRHLWQGSPAGVMPVFVDDEHPQLGKGRGRKGVSNVLQWMRASNTRLALLTNGRQWRLLYAGLDADAFCEWDAERWFEEGGLGMQVNSLRLLMQPALWTQLTTEQTCPLLQAVQDSRKGQAELSNLLGEHVREAVELLVQAHGEQLKVLCANVDPADIYRAAVRMVMRLVVVFFAESRDLLPRSSSLYHRAYGLNGLLEALEKHGGSKGERLVSAYGAWPRILALFRLVHAGSPHPALPIHAYGGELFEAGETEHVDGLKCALAVFESACYQHLVMSDRDVFRLLKKISRTEVKVRQGRGTTMMHVPVPVDFSDLSSEYIGILYEGLLDFELKIAPEGDPVIFLAVGNEPALPLSRLEGMNDAQLKSLLESMKDTSKREDAEGADEDNHEPEIESGEATDVELTEGEEGLGEKVDESATDHRHSTRTRAEEWARRVVQVAGLVRKPSRRLSAEKQAEYERTIAQKAEALVRRVVLPGEWFLVRWGGTRKGAGTFYTRPGLAVPTVHRTLRPLAFDAPLGADGKPDTLVPAALWTPKKPEEILALKVCDPACGSGSFPVAALRFLTEAVYTSLHHHRRIATQEDRALVTLLHDQPGAPETLGTELIPARPEDETFEARLKARLRRHVVERCIYGVDLDPLAVELCRLALWVETMDRDLPFSFLDHKVKCGNGLVGAWFDQFQHYPVMAWKNREAGDKSHTNGVHYEKDALTKAIKQWVKDTLTPDLSSFLQGRTLFAKDLQESAANAHEESLAVLKRLHDLPVYDSAERARIYRTELLGSDAYQRMKTAMDMWCACWFWPADALTAAPLPSTFSEPTAETKRLVADIARRKRFFHWELEFPDVFRQAGDGFDAMIGNPPWETAKPNSKEFFSRIDPLYRTYGKQDALRKQTEYFAASSVEQDWLRYSADYRAQSNWVGYVGFPFGDPAHTDNSTDKFTLRQGAQNNVLHDKWRKARMSTKGYSDVEHGYRYQGAGDVNLYKMFLEQGHALLRKGGRMGFIVPSGIYSDYGSAPLRRRFLDHCQWEWLFGFENRLGIFEIHRSFKFNPVIVCKGGSTAAICTAFMRRVLEDWERAEELAVPYSRDQVERFSPKSLAILEIQSQRDLEVLEKIYTNSVLLGDDGPDGWGVKYGTEFHMTNDSKLFPPRQKWEEQGYAPDEYSRWLKGKWRSIAELWTELGIDPTRVEPATVELEEWLFDTSASPERRAADARLVHGHILKPGDVTRSQWRARCAQPPYDTLPIPRASIPAGIILSRDADAFIHEDKIEDVALPLYEGKDIWIHDWSYVSDANGSSSYRSHLPQYLMRELEWKSLAGQKSRLVFRDISNATNTRSFVPALIPHRPCSNGVPLLSVASIFEKQKPLLCAWLGSLVFDWTVRQRMSGTHVNWHIAESLGVPSPGRMSVLLPFCQKVDYSDIVFSAEWLGTGQLSVPTRQLAPAEKARQLIAIDTFISGWLELGLSNLRLVLAGSDSPRPSRNGSSKGFWRVDKDKDPELRYTVLTLVAYHDLESKIREHGGDRERGLEAFLNQNEGEGWLLPETLRLADYGLGHDERAQHHQPVASRLGPRYYDWQLAQTPEESWKECHLHARNLLGEAGYQQLLERIEAEKRGEVWQPPLVEKPRAGIGVKKENGQQELF